MDYSESLVNGGVTYQHKCTCCENNKHHVKGVIRYAYFILESLPLFPVGRTIKLECSECLNIVEHNDIESALRRTLTKTSFTIYQFAFRFLGVFLIAYGVFSWWQSTVEKRAEVEYIVNFPQINDFFLLDYRKISNDLRPNEKYRVAKIIDMTGDTISFAYGNFFYSYQSSFEGAISSGQTRSFSYFSKNSYHYTIDEFNALYRKGGVVKAARPKANMLFGNFVINETGYQVGGAYNPGERQFASGLAFEQANYLQDYKFKAFQQFEKSADMGFSLGQIKLAEYYLAGDVVHTDFQSALYWLEAAALQSRERAIKKYVIVCQQTKGCDERGFYQRLIDNGVNLTVNNSGVSLD